MDFEFAINVLTGHLKKLDNRYINFESWLDTAIELLSETFGGGSVQTRNFNEIKGDFKLKKIYDKSEKLIGDYRSRCKEQLASIILILMERQKDEQRKRKEESEKLKTVFKQVFPPTNVTTPAPKAVTETEPVKAFEKPSETTLNESKMATELDRKHYTIGITLFWTIILPFIAGVFFFGYYVGTTKFDQDKINLAEKNRDLKDSINVLQNRLSVKDDSIKVLKRAYMLFIDHTNRLNPSDKSDSTKK